VDPESMLRTNQRNSTSSSSLLRHTAAGRGYGALRESLKDSNFLLPVVWCAYRVPEQACWS